MGVGEQVIAGRHHGGILGIRHARLWRSSDQRLKLWCIGWLGRQAEQVVASSRYSSA
jgi:hypothetical protein